MNEFDSALRRDHWPTTPVEERVFPVEDEGLFAAAKMLALLAYPARLEQKFNGPAHKFAVALIATAFRLAKARKRVHRLPDYVARLKPQTMRNTIKKGERRLDYRFAAIQVIFEAALRVACPVSSDHF